MGLGARIAAVTDTKKHIDSIKQSPRTIVESKNEIVLNEMMPPLS